MAKISVRVTKLLTFTSLLLQIVRCECDIGERSLASSIIGMKILLETEHQLLSAMEDYVNQLENKLRIIRSVITEIQTEYLKSQLKPEEYLSNSISNYALIHRLHEGWAYLELFLSSLVGADKINRMNELRSAMPTSLDLAEAFEGIYRLNTIYDIQPADMAAGLMNGKQYDARFSAIDCFSIGYFMFQNERYYLSGVWLYASLQLYQDIDMNAVLEFDKVKILELYAKVLLKQDYLNEALKVIKIALKLSPHKTELLRTKSEIEFRIRTPTEAVAEETEQVQGMEEDDFLVSESSMMKYDCRQYTYHSKLHCLYNKTTTAFLQLAPLKMEILNLDPYVVLYHDVISDVEIADLKNEAENKLRCLKAVTNRENSSKVIKGRKSYWFYNPTDIVRRIDQRIADMSGFDLKDSDNLLVMNYGIAGIYGPHFDAFDSIKIFEEGDRMASVIFYLSDVDQGGATVFPNIEISVRPKKGNALMFYNLNIKGEIDEGSFHGACPVIVGSKWVLTKWIRQYSQMFRRPCFA